MKVTQEELTALLKESTSENIAQLKFGPGWVELLDTADNEWAKRRLEEMRAQDGRG